MPQVILSRQLASPGKVIMEEAHNLLSTINYIEKKHKADSRTGGFVASYDKVKAFRLCGRGLHGAGHGGNELPKEV